MKLIFALWVTLMIPGFAQVDEWEKFNSSLLIEVTRPNGVFTCTGVAVSDQLIITAAHCLEGDVKQVRIFTGSKYDAKASSLAVKDYKIHPKYNAKESRFKSDLAKISLKDKLPGFVKLHSIYSGKRIDGTLYRFGFGERNKQNIRTVITPKFRNLNFDDAVIELNDQFSRSGDSGGPIYMQNGDEITVLAVHSTFSHGPEGNFSFNPLLGSYTSWIFSN